MGLRHRTPSSIIREHRRRAALDPHGPQRRPASISSTPRRPPLQFRPLGDWAGTTSTSGVGLHALPQDGQEKSQKLLSRLREMLAPGSAPVMTSSHIECQSLEEEIGRLVQASSSPSKSQQTKADALLREVFIPHGPQKTIAPETSPYRTIQLGRESNKLGIVKLTESLGDLSFFQVPEERPAPSPSLTLVTAAPEGSEAPAPEELGAETASVMQQLLEAAKKKSQAVSHPKNLILSLLD